MFNKLRDKTNSGFNLTSPRNANILLSSRCYHEGNLIGSAVPYAIATFDLAAFAAAQLTLILLTWRICWTPNNARKWQMVFNSAFEGLITACIFFGICIITIKFREQLFYFILFTLFYLFYLFCSFYLFYFVYFILFYLFYFVHFILFILLYFLYFILPILFILFYSQYIRTLL